MGHLKECTQRYGVETCRELKRRLIGGTVNGKPLPDFVIWPKLFARYEYGDGVKRCRTPLKGETYNCHARSSSFGSRNFLAKHKIKASDLYEHWLAEPDQIERMIAYTNRCPVIGGRRIGLFMLDVDCHHGQSMVDARATAERIENTLGNPIYWEPSTSGSGSHGYTILSWYPTVSYAKIREDLKSLAKGLGALTSGMRATCDEVCGSPMLLRNREIEKFGTWAKVPRPQTCDEAELLLSVMNTETACSALLRRLETLETQEGCNSIGVQPALLPHQTEPKPVKTKPIAITNMADDPNTFKRTHAFIQKYRPANPEATKGQAFIAYCQAGLAIGKSDEKNFNERWEFSEKTWDPAKAQRQGIESFLPEATGLILGALETNGLASDLQADLTRRRAVYRRQKKMLSTLASLRRLDQDRLAKLYACMRWELGDKAKTWGKAQAQSLMLQVFGLKVSNGEFKAAMRWFRRNRLARLVMSQIWTKDKSGRCRVYEMLPQPLDGSSKEIV